MIERRTPLKLCEDREPMFPVQAFFNSIGDRSLPYVVTHLLTRTGFSSDYCHCRFPADLDPGEALFVGVQFLLFEDHIVISEKQFADILETDLQNYLAVHPEPASVLIEHLEAFRQIMR